MDEGGWNKSQKARQSPVDAASPVYFPYWLASQVVMRATPLWFKLKSAIPSTCRANASWFVLMLASVICTLSGINNNSSPCEMASRAFNSAPLSVLRAYSTFDETMPPAFSTHVTNRSKGYASPELVRLRKAIKQARAPVMTAINPAKFTPTPLADVLRDSSFLFAFCFSFALAMVEGQGDSKTNTKRRAIICTGGGEGGAQPRA
mmetsp:Transcript_64472/g.185323  ORF Transcript_64472/g.185323 Transcript_64472/m.185323 type:complete len:205 (+) Transcript_64472:1083-1697(+)